MDMVFHARTIHIEKGQIGRAKRPQRARWALSEFGPATLGYRTNVRERGSYRALG